MSKHAMLAVIIALLITIAGGVTYMGLQTKKANDLKEQEQLRTEQIQKQEAEQSRQEAENWKKRRNLK